MIPNRLRWAALATALMALLVTPEADAAATAPAARRPPARRAPIATPRRASPPRSSAQVALEAKKHEDEGEYAAAVASLRELRRLVPPDADLELSLALDEARSGQPDSAWVRLHAPLLAAAFSDSGLAERRREYAFELRDGIWRSGAYEGWNWYVARARAEIALARGQWVEAYDAARIAVAARPLAGKEHLLLAVAAGRAGRAAESEREATLASELDAMLPEAHYLAGVWHWRSGRRAEAREAFERAIGCDSSFRLAALALVRLRLASVTADTLPARFLTGARRAALLTSPLRPKQEETPRFDVPAGVLGQPRLELTAERKAELHLTRTLRLFVNVLVDERGRPVVNDLPWAPVETLPRWLVGELTRVASTWRFQPAQKLGHGISSWATIELQLAP